MTHENPALGDRIWHRLVHDSFLNALANLNGIAASVSAADVSTLVAVAEAAIDLWRRDGAPHARAEEEQWFPALAGAGGAEDRTALSAEHAAIAALIADLDQAVQRQDGPNLAGLLARLLHAVEDHFQHEDAVLAAGFQGP
ncbi:MAG: hemerythrin domain-containing protein [Firmicutes bacterium]|nr:hemerythrin domain-containing protein [Alicyclobacillaceae bacterium]MCL6496727.1 hemerythrin domain-containing protein [Bacillota bacterium]